MQAYNLSSPASMPPSKLFKIYARKDLGGFLSTEDAEITTDNRFQVIESIKGK